ncbi:hypothetical protein HYH03_008892 [Edaphochlamys debaryana]|uniref:Uncharacterized protein n=1 Tax=Edaphochlamys debaryana TaxID=47281 RepID=A0A835XZ87_9CHLO|nr:hypothetical protein HYH03_008892 [Edaphochlamys debaryana]|eukprot:KAG2492993.1 hypothetical protein HYH03_008892 [Edaphochlamys debaryana]
MSNRESSGEEVAARTSEGESSASDGDGHPTAAKGTEGRTAQRQVSTISSEEADGAAAGASNALGRGGGRRGRSRGRGRQRDREAKRRAASAACNKRRRELETAEQKEARLAVQREQQAAAQERRRDAAADTDEDEDERVDPGRARREQRRQRLAALDAAVEDWVAERMRRKTTRNERERQQRAAETEEQKAQRRERRRQQRATETAEQRDQRRERQRQQRAAETAEQRDQRRERQHQQRAVETAEQRDQRRERQRQQRAAETEEQRNQRLALENARHRLRRLLESPEQTAARQARHAAAPQPLTAATLAQHAELQRQAQNVLRRAQLRRAALANAADAEAAVGREPDDTPAPGDADDPAKPIRTVAGDMLDACRWPYRRENDPETCCTAAYLTDNLFGWRSSIKDYPPGESMPGIPLEVQMDTAYKMADYVRTHMPSRVCACCSCMKSEAEAKWVRLSDVPNVQLLRADIASTLAVEPAPRASPPAEQPAMVNGVLQTGAYGFDPAAQQAADDTAAAAGVPPDAPEDAAAAAVADAATTDGADGAVTDEARRGLDDGADDGADKAAAKAMEADAGAPAEEPEMPDTVAARSLETFGPRADRLPRPDTTDPSRYLAAFCLRVDEAADSPNRTARRTEEGLELTMCNTCLAGLEVGSSSEVWSANLGSGA